MESALIFFLFLVIWLLIFLGGAIYLVIHIGCLIYAHFHPEVKDDVLWRTDPFT